MNTINCGHRGASATQPEDTLPSFIECLRIGASAVELDVRTCKTGELIVLHDADVARTTNGHGPVAAMSLQELQSLDAGHGNHIPTLNEVLRALAHSLPDGTNPTIFIELKSPTTAALRTVIASIETARSTFGYSYAQLPVISFSWQQLRPLKRLLPQLITGVSLKNLPVLKPLLLPVACMVQADMVCADYRLVNAAFMQRAHGSNITVAAWEVSESTDMQRLIDLGVDCIMTDYPDRLQQLLTAPGTLAEARL